MGNTGRPANEAGSRGRRCSFFSKSLLFCTMPSFAQKAPRALPVVVSGEVFWDDMGRLPHSRGPGVDCHRVPLSTRDPMVRTDDNAGVVPRPIALSRGW